MSKSADKARDRDIKRWIERTLSLSGVDLPSVIDVFLSIAKAHGFEVRKRYDSEDGVRIEAIYGSRLTAFLYGLIPFVGRHLPRGKRLGMKASVTKAKSIDLDINITPYMELFDESEALVVSQSVDEKATDEYFAAFKLDAVTKDLYSRLDLNLPEEFSRFEVKTFALDFFLAILIYPLDGYKSVKRIYIPSEVGPKWNWWGFIMPEIYFVWHEIWGVSVLTIILEFYAINLSVEHGVPHACIPILPLMLRVLTGRLGNLIYYYRYGRWPK